MHTYLRVLGGVGKPQVGETVGFHLG
jgi:hypothetical protein